MQNLEHMPFGMGQASPMVISVQRDGVSVLFGMGDKLPSSRENEDLLEAFEKLEVERIGVGKHEEFHELMHELQDIYLNRA